MTFWKSSAPATASHTSWSTSSIERRSDRREETWSSCSSAVRWRAASTASCAPWRARAVSETMATSRSSWSSEGRMPDTGSPTDTMPSRCPSECRQGTNSSSPGTQASVACALGWSGT